jgi:adenylate cyclase class IV
MPTNVEIKARVGDIDDLRTRARTLAGGEPERLFQEDTYFLVAEGRLKLRAFGDGTGELIYYERDDDSEPAPSTYLISPVSDVPALAAALSAALGVRGIVRKEREVFMVGRTRVHVDIVDGMGTFMELEVVLGPRDSEEDGRAEAERLMEALAVRPEDLLEGSYIDLADAAA